MYSIYNYTYIYIHVSMQASCGTNYAVFCITDSLNKHNLNSICYNIVRKHSNISIIYNMYVHVCKQKLKVYTDAGKPRAR